MYPVRPPFFMIFIYGTSTPHTGINGIILMAPPEGKHRTTINLSLVLTDALKMRGAIERRSITSLLEEAAWAYLELKGDRAHQERRIEKLVAAARLT